MAMESTMEVSFEQGWAKMEEGIVKLKRILEGSPESFTSEEYMTLYSTIYDLCNIRVGYSYGYYSSQLCGKHHQVLKEHVQSVVLPSLKDKQDEFMLREFMKQWTNIDLMGHWLSKFFSYLERAYIYQRILPSLTQVPVEAFRDMVFKELNGKVTDVVIALIDKEREGNMIDRTLVQKVISIIIDMGMGVLDFYLNNFEKQMIDDAGCYYSFKASGWMVQDSYPDYMIKAEESLKKEREIVAHYLHWSSEPKLIQRVQHELLVVHQNQLLGNKQSGCLALLREEKLDDIFRTFRLFGEIPKGLEPVASIFNQYMVDEGKALVQLAEEDARNKEANMEQNFFGKIMELHDKFMAYVSRCFGAHRLFYLALREAFEVICNQTIIGVSSSEILATFCDNLVSKSDNEKLSDEAVEETMDKALMLLVYINDKDLFAEFYRKKLARRLLFDKSGKKDYDKIFLSKLKHHFGGNFTSKMEGMLTDVTLARENQKGLEDWFCSNPDEKPKFDLSVTILTTRLWPSYKSSDLNLPPEMVQGVKAFKKFYETITKQRKLTWIYSLGNCLINGKFEHKAIELIVSTYQAACLMLFNNADRLSFSEIMTQLNLCHDDLVRVLHSLSCSKYKILKKEPNTESISQTDSFECNTKFTNKMRRIRILLPPVDERKKINEDVDKDRKYNIDAALVRIMKSRKVLGYQQLISECVEMLSHNFKPDITAIKKRIEDLINREFLERDPKNPTIFKYLA